MTDVVGNWVDGSGYHAFRSKASIWTNQTNTTVKINISAWVEMDEGYDGGWNFYKKFVIGSDTPNTYTSASNEHFDAGHTYSIGSSSRTYTRTHSNQSIQTGIGVHNSGDFTPWGGVDSYAGTWVSVPAKPSYSVAYSANGGSSTPSTQTKWLDEPLTLASAISRGNSTSTITVTFNANSGSSTGASGNKLTATKTTSYTFYRWKDSGGNLYQAGASYSSNSGTTMTAQWSSTSSTTAITLPTPTRTGYTFNGWYTQSSGGTRVGGAGGKYTPSANITLFAQWTQSTWAITYNANGGDGAPATQTKEFNKAITLHATRPTRTGYTFVGWGTSSGATTATYQPGDSYSTNAALNLYAVWSIITFSVTYDANGGSGAPSSQTKNYGDNNFKLSGRTPTRIGCIFLGWNTAFDGSGTAYSSGQTYTGNANLALYAVWLGARVTSITSYKCTENGTKAEDGAYGYLDAKWDDISTVPSATVSVSAKANDVDIALENGTKRSTSIFGGSYTESDSLIVEVTLAVSVTYNGATKSVDATKKLVVPKAFRLLSATHGAEFDGVNEGIAIGAVATLVGRLEVALQSIFRKPLNLIQSTFGRDEDVESNSDGDVQINFLDRLGNRINWIVSHKNTDGTNYLRLTTFGKGAALSSSLYIGNDGTRKRIGTDAKWTTSPQVESTGMGYWLVDSTGTDYPGVHDNGSNLWIGAVDSNSRQHVGQTYISAGHNGTSGNPTIYVAVPNADNTGASLYGVYHTNNKPTPAAIGALPLTGGTLTGALTMHGAAIILKDDRLNRDGSVSSDVWSMVNEFRDADGERFGGMQVFQLKDGRDGVCIQAFSDNSSGTQVLNAFEVMVDKSGNQTYWVSSPANFRKAIGAAAGSEYDATLTQSNCSGGSIALHVRGKIGLITVSGVKINTISARTTFCTVPSGYRPVGQRYGYINGRYNEYLIVNSNGAVQGDAGLSGATIWAQVMFEIA